MPIAYINQKIPPFTLLSMWENLLFISFSFNNYTWIHGNFFIRSKWKLIVLYVNHLNSDSPPKSEVFYFQISKSWDLLISNLWHQIIFEQTVLKLKSSFFRIRPSFYVIFSTWYFRIDACNLILTSTRCKDAKVLWKHILATHERT